MFNQQIFLSYFHILIFKNSVIPVGFPAIIIHFGKKAFFSIDFLQIFLLSLITFWSAYENTDH